MKRCRFCGHGIVIFPTDNTWWSREISMNGTSIDNGFYCSGEWNTQRHKPLNFQDYLNQVEADVV